MADDTRELLVHAGPGADAHSDVVAVEEPLEIRVDCNPIGVTMRTPGADAALAVGFLFAEGLLRVRTDVMRVVVGPEGGAGEARNTVNVLPGPDAIEHLAGLQRRQTLTTASCGVCGRESIDDLRARCAPVRPTALAWDTLHTAVAALGEAQPLFARTGGVHAASVHDADGARLAAFEDIGRHNAVDKAIGTLWLREELDAAALLVVSGRASFEIVQKAVNAGIGAVASVSAASSLAVELAREMGVLLVGFARDGRGTVYAGAERLR